jgi:hypothetical protein
MKEIQCNLDLVTHIRPVASVGAGGALAPHFLAKQLTLSQPGGQIIPTTVIQAPPDFQTLRRACIWLFKKVSLNCMVSLNKRDMKVHIGYQTIQKSL